MNKFIAITTLGAISIALGVLAMMHGWGVQPKSWWWIIGVGVAGRIIIEIMSAVGKQE